MDASSVIAPANRAGFPWRSVFIFAAILGPFCFLLNNLALWSGALNPPLGYVPRYALSNLDVPLYLTWMTLAPSHWLLPNYNAPWASDDALLSPLVLTAGRLSHIFGFTPLVGFQVFHFLLYCVAAFALGAVLWAFCSSTRQRAAAMVGIFLAIPFPLMALGWSRLAGKEIPIFWIGLVQYSYETSDGLLRGGSSNSFTLSFGTAANLLGLFLLTRYVRDRRQRDLVLLGITAFLSAFFHPVEACVIGLASLVTFTLLAWRERRFAPLFYRGTWMSGSVICGLLPYIIQTTRSEWLRDISRLWRWDATSILWVPMVFGIPTVLVTYFLLLRFRLRAPGDEVLLVWFLATVGLIFLPGVPFKLHMFDGFAYIAAILLVRLVWDHPHIRSLATARPRLIYAGITVACLLCVPGYATLYGQIWRDGHAAQPDLLVNAVAPSEESAFLDWARHNLRHDQLIMAPADTAPWLATVPMPSMTSHDQFSVTFEEQSKRVNAFYAGKLTATEADALLGDYGVHYLAIPSLSPGTKYAAGLKVAGTTGAWIVYELPDSHRPPYPGLAALRPDIARQADFGALVMATRKFLTR